MTKEEYEKLTFKYQLALKKIKNEMEIVDGELEISNDTNPIEYIKTRIKSYESITKKLIARGYKVTKENVLKHMHDISGIRIICSFLSDIYKIENIIKNDKNIQIIERKDYIENPKTTGYSSLHLIALVPIPTLNEVEYIKVEIQIRTIAMDMWASLEHKLLYKSKNKYPKQLNTLMYNYANITKNIDILMENMVKESNMDTNEINSNGMFITELEEIRKIDMLKYKLAQQVVQNKIENIKKILEATQKNNPIEHVKTRIKKPTSIIKKLQKSNYEITEENIVNHVHDLIGTRIVCSFLDDLYEIKEIIKNDPTITVIKEKDYIKRPKSNGYRSYHINILIPINMLGKIENIEVEIQLRTIAMEMWASLEHKICYQKNGKIPLNTIESLKGISELMYELDNRISNLTISKKTKTKLLSPDRYTKSACNPYKESSAY